MITAERFSEPDTIYLYLTSKCNAACSFCSGHDRMLAADTPLSVQKGLLLEALERYPNIVNFNWSGGEPLLAWNRLVELYGLIKEKRPNARHTMVTNGIKLRRKHLEILREFGNVNVSIDGFECGERPLRAFLKERAYEAFEVMKELGSLGIVSSWAVVRRDQLDDPLWWEDLALLHRSFYHYGMKCMNIQIDKHMTKPLNSEQVDNLLAGLAELGEALERLNFNTGGDLRTMVERIFDTPCNECSKVLEIDSSGRMGQTPNTEVVIQGGCNELAKAIGVEAYTRLLAYFGERR